MYHRFAAGGEPPLLNNPSAGGGSAGTQKYVAALLFFALALGLGLGLGLKRAPSPSSAPSSYTGLVARAFLFNSSTGEALGAVTLRQDNLTAPVFVDVAIYASNMPNLNAFHGIHIHNTTLASQSALDSLCVQAGGHFNPSKVNHTCSSATGHAGDLGSIFISAGGASSRFVNANISLFPGSPTSVLNRAIVLHADPDDCGVGGQADSKTTGHSGARLACGVILGALDGF